MRRCVLFFAVACGCGHSVVDRETAAPQQRFHDDRERLAYIEEATRCVAEAAGVDPTIEILDTATVAAYARPGDRVALSRGLLAHLRSEAELEAVAAHELAHLASGHVRAHEQEPADAGLFAEIVGAAKQAAHSRAEESEADAKAVEYLAACGRSARAMIDLFDVLERVEEEDDVSPWFATHPSFADRRERSSAQRDAIAPRDAGHAAYVEALAGLVYGEDPRAGFVTGRDYVVPSLDVRLALPEAWSSRIADGTLVSQSPKRGTFLVVERVPPGNAVARLQAALDAGKIPGGEIESYALGSTRVTIVGFTLGTSGGMIVHLELDSAALVLFGISPRDDWKAFANEIYGAIESFRPIEDPELARVQPRRLGTLRLDKPTTLAEIARRSALDVEELARLNALSPTAPLPRGTVLKIVTQPGASGSSRYSAKSPPPSS